MADSIEGRLNTNSAAAQGQSARAWSACMGCKGLARGPAARFAHLGASITRGARRPTCSRRGSRVSSFEEVEEDGVVGSGRCAAGTGAPATCAGVDHREPAASLTELKHRRVPTGACPDPCQTPGRCASIEQLRLLIGEDHLVSTSMAPMQQKLHRDSIHQTVYSFPRISTRSLRRLRPYTDR